MTHFAYNEWPLAGGGAGAEDSVLVPGSTHGILGLVEHALAHQEEASLTGPIAVHCRSGLIRVSPVLPTVNVACVFVITSQSNKQPSTINTMSVAFIHVSYISLSVKLNINLHLKVVKACKKSFKTMALILTLLKEYQVSCAL